MATFNTTSPTYHQPALRPAPRGRTPGNVRFDVCHVHEHSRHACVLKRGVLLFLERGGGQVQGGGREIRTRLRKSGLGAPKIILGGAYFPGLMVPC